MKRILLLLLLLLSAAACTTAKAKAPEVKPALDVPPVPPRVIEPLPSTEPVSIERIPDLPPEQPPPARKPPARETTKPESKPDVKPEPVADPTASAPTTTPVPPLRTPGSAEGPAAERQVRTTQDRARKLLDSINASTLTNDRLNNFNLAKQFLQQSEEQLKAGNISQAKSHAERAENIAVLLIGR